MAAVWYGFRAEVRSRWRAWLGLAVLVGIAGGAVVALAAGARRTETAYDRFLRTQNAWHVMVAIIPDEGTATLDPEEIARLPQVEDIAVTHISYLDLGGGQTAWASPDGRFGRDMNRFKILTGRRADPDRPEEALVPFTVAEDYGLEVGDRLDLYYDPDELAAQVPPDQRTPEQQTFLDGLQRLTAALPDGQLEVVGIEASPGEFPPQFAGGAPVHLTPAYDRLGWSDGEQIAVRLRNGGDDVDAFRRELERLGDGRPVDIAVQAELSRNIQRSFHLQAVSMWLLAGLVALVGVLTVAQLLARQAFFDTGADHVLNALGMTRVQRWVLGVTRVTAMAACGALVTVALAVLLSPLMPTGLARTAEPDPGFRVDTLAVVVGAPGVFLVVSLLAAWPVWRATRQGRGAEGVAGAAGLSTPSRLSGAMSRAGVPAPAGIGIRLALEPGRGRSAVPVRTTLTVVTLGVAVLVATLTFGASFTHLLDTPRLYGVNWDFSVSNYGTGPSLDAEGADITRQVPGIDGFSLAIGDLSLDVAGEHTEGLALDTVEGGVRPQLIEGRAPSAADEIVLGERTREAAGVDIGERVLVSSSVADRHHMRVVGTAVLPIVSPGAGLGEGALFTFEGLDRFVEERSEDGPVMLLRLAPGATQAQVIADLQASFERFCDQRPERCPDGPGDLAVQPDGKPTDVINFGRVRNMPLVLGGVLALLAAGTLTHVLVSAIRRRRRDLAILKAIGFERGQVMSAVAWQASVTIGVALLLGVPVGVALGRWAWRLLADDLGILAEPQVPLVAILLTGLSALVLANLIAALPARAAGRTQPATVLRTE